MNPLVSIITATYNRASFLPAMIESVQKQTFTRWELLIIDDGSVDDTASVMLPYLKTDKRITFIRNDQNYGVSRTRNQGIALSQGIYIAILDSDDYWLDATKIEKQVACFEQDSRIVLIGTGIRCISASGEFIRDISAPSNDRLIRRSLLTHNIFFHSSVLIRRGALNLSGFYNERMSYAEDYDLWLRLGKLGNFLILPEPLTAYRVHAHSESARHGIKKAIVHLALVWRYRDAYPQILRALVWGVLRIIRAVVTREVV